MPKGVKATSRDWPLSPRECRVVERAWKLARHALADQCRRNRRLEDEIQSEFARRLVCRIQAWNPARCDLKAFAIATLKYATLQARHIDRTGSRHIEPVDVVLEVESLQAPAEVAGIDEYLCHLSAREKDAVRMTIEDRGSRQVGAAFGMNQHAARRIVVGALSSIRQSLERATA